MRKLDRAWSVGIMSLGLALALAPDARAGDKDKGKDGRPSALIIFGSPEEHGGKPDVRFSASQTIDVNVGVLFPEDFEGRHQLELRFHTPRGFLYQSIAVPIAAATDDENEREIEGYPDPVKDKKMQEFEYLDKKYRRVDVPFPVGGTLITTNSLYGVWTVEAFLDGSTTPCAGPTPVAIKQ